MRRQHETLERVYAYGGLGAFGAATLTLVLFFVFSTLAAVLPWVFASMVFLVALYIVRQRVQAAKRRLLTDVEQYCLLNELDVDALREHFAQAHTYPFFHAIFEGSRKRLSKES